MLVLVPTPVGNLHDVTRRALEVLQRADVIVCEDTRVTGQLLKHYGIAPRKLLSSHEHNEQVRAVEVVRRITSGETVALVSDAGMPGISDPGFRLVRACIDAGCAVTALPGPSAAITALAASGLPSDAFYFAGFPPQKKGRQTFLRALLERRETCVMYESPHRLERLLEEIAAIAGADRQVVVAREISKLHEEYLRGTVAEIHGVIGKRGGVKGECIVLVHGAEAP